MSYTSENPGDTGSRATVSAFFDARDDAERSIEDLIAAGVPRDSIRMTAGNEDRVEVAGHAAPNADADADEDKGFFGTLGDFFFPDDDRSAYAEGLNRGGFLITVGDVAEDLHDAVLEILDDEGAVDIDDRAATWRAEGWTGTNAAGDVLPTGVRGTTHDASFTNPREGNETELLDASYEGKSMLAGRDDIGDSLDLGNDGNAETPRATSPSRHGDDLAPAPAGTRLPIGTRNLSHGRLRVRSYTYSAPFGEEALLAAEPEDRVLTPRDGDLRDSDTTAAVQPAPYDEPPAGEAIDRRHAEDAQRRPAADTRSADAADDLPRDIGERPLR